MKLDEILERVWTSGKVKENAVAQAKQEIEKLMLTKEEIFNKLPKKWGYGKRVGNMPKIIAEQTAQTIYNKQKERFL